jgi:hypothetical protein
MADIPNRPDNIAGISTAITLIGVAPILRASIGLKEDDASRHLREVIAEQPKQYDAILACGNAPTLGSRQHMLRS